MEITAGSWGLQQTKCHSSLEGEQEGGSTEVQAGQPHINHQKELPHAPHYRLGAKCLESSFAGKDSGILVDTKLNMSQQRVLTAKKAKTIRNSITRKLREVIISL